MAPAKTEQADQARQRMTSDAASISPSKPTAVPQGGLLRSIQNTSNQSQDKNIRVDKVEIHTAKPMSPLELENMMSMAVGA